MIRLIPLVALVGCATPDDSYETLQTLKWEVEDLKHELAATKDKLDAHQSSTAEAVNTWSESIAATEDAVDDVRGEIDAVADAAVTWAPSGVSYAVPADGNLKDVIDAAYGYQIPPGQVVEITLTAGKHSLGSRPLPDRVRLVGAGSTHTIVTTSGVPLNNGQRDVRLESLSVEGLLTGSVPAIGMAVGPGTRLQLDDVALTGFGQCLVVEPGAWVTGNLELSSCEVGADVTGALHLDSLVTSDVDLALLVDDLGSVEVATGTIEARSAFEAKGASFVELHEAVDYTTVDESVSREATHIYSDESLHSMDWGYWDTPFVTYFVPYESP